MVGRERELATLQRVTADLRTGRGGIVSIIGEAGLGKSRLIAEWRKSLFPFNPSSEKGSEVRLVEGRCLSYGSGVAYHLSSDILRAMVGVAPNATQEETHTALRSSSDRLLGGEGEEVYPFLGHILGLKLEEEAAARVKHLDGPALQARYVGAFRQFLGALTREAPTIIVADDVHWADPSSVELGIQLLPLTAQIPLVIVFVTRPDQETAGWRLVTGAREVPGVSAVELHLSPLAEEDSRQLVSNLLHVSALPENLRQLILAKAEGNPFYVEEVIRMLIDRGSLAHRENEWVVTRDIQSIDIPDTLQGVIMARIDRLPEDAKRVLQIASVIGRRFQVQVLEMVLAQQDA